MLSQEPEGCKDAWFAASIPTDGLRIKQGDIRVEEADIMKLHDATMEMLHKAMPELNARNPDGTPYVRGISGCADRERIPGPPH